MMNATTWFQRLRRAAERVDFLAPLAIRAYLVPIFWMAGNNKLAHMDGTIAWFGNPDWGLGLPFPTFMAWAAALSETVGAILLASGFAVRLASLPLMTTMAVAALAVHWENGWLAVADGGSEAARRLNGLMQWLAAEHPGRHEYVTELGSPAVLNNGVEFAVTYFIMLLALLVFGAGRYVSADYWVRALWDRRADHVAGTL